MANAVLESVGYSPDELQKSKADLFIAKQEFIFHNRVKRQFRKKIGRPIVGLWPGYVQTYQHEYKLAIDSWREYLIRKRSIALMSKMTTATF